MGTSIMKDEEYSFLQKLTPVSDVKKLIDNY